MAASAEQQIAVSQNPPPSAEKVRAAASEYMARAGMEPVDLAAEINYAPVTLRHFFSGIYHNIASTDVYIRAAIWEHIQGQPLPGQDANLPEKLIMNWDTRLILERIEQARERGYVIAIEGPPGTSKTVTLRWHAAERARLKKFDAFYLRAWTHISAVDVLKRFGGQVGAFVRTGRGRLLSNLARRLRARGPCVLLVDEAQKLVEYGIEPFEQLRDVVDEAACGLVLAGHFSFLAVLSNGLGRKVEQWLSRIPIREHLRGLQRDELAEVCQEYFSDAGGDGEPPLLNPETLALVGKLAQAHDRNAIFRARYARQKFDQKYLNFRRIDLLFRRVRELREIPGNENASLGGLIQAAAGKMMEAM